MITIETIKKMLEEKDIEPSFQRIKIYEYLIKEKNHPTVNIIYRDLAKKIPTLSKTTVYNNLKLFEKKGMIIRLNMSDNEVRFDADTSLHGHFRCKNCGKIIDFKINKIETDLKEVKVEEKHVNYFGVCKQCQNKEETGNGSEKIN